MHSVEHIKNIYNFVFLHIEISVGLNCKQTAKLSVAIIYSADPVFSLNEKRDYKEVFNFLFIWWFAVLPDATITADSKRGILFLLSLSVFCPN